ncbi:AraC family transcriptional regulator [Streptomyces sp. NPDC054770]
MAENGQTEPTVTMTRVLPGGTTIAPHRHRGHQVVYASQGVLAVETDTGTWIAPAARAIWVPARVRHAHRAYGTTSFHTLALGPHTNPLRLNQPTVLRVSPLLREILISYSSLDPSDAGTARRQARLRAVLLDELEPVAQPPLHLPAPHDDRLTAACALVTADPGAHRDLAAVAGEVGVGRRTLSRLFAQEFGMSFPQWRTQVRLELALRLLAEGTSVTATGHRCGWSSTSSFVDVFRRHMGYTPGSRPS